VHCSSLMIGDFVTSSHDLLQQRVFLAAAAADCSAALVAPAQTSCPLPVIAPRQDRQVSLILAGAAAAAGGFWSLVRCHIPGLFLLDEGG